MDLDPFPEHQERKEREEPAYTREWIAIFVVRLVTGRDEEEVLGVVLQVLHQVAHLGTTFDDWHVNGVGLW